jgi:hypothetical protein
MAIQPAKWNIQVQRRSTWRYYVELLDENDNPIDLTGANIYSQIWDKKRDVKYADFSIEYVDQSLGKFYWVLAAEDSVNLPCECFYDMLIVDSLSAPYYLVEGLVFVSEGYTSS